MGRPICLALIVDDEPIPVQVRWAVHLARMKSMNLLLVLFRESDQSRLKNIDLKAPDDPEEDGSVTELRQAVAEHSDVSALMPRAPNTDAPFTVSQASTGPTASGEQIHSDEKTVAGDESISAKMLCYNETVWARKTITDEVSTLGVSLFTIARKQFFSETNQEFIVERGRFYEFLPCQIILCQGLTDETDFKHVAILAQPGGNQQVALRLASNLTGEGGTLEAIQVNPNVGDDAQMVGERRLERFLEKRPKDVDLSVSRHVVVNDSTQNAVQSLLQERTFGILVVPGRALKPEQGVGLKLGRNVPVAVVTAPSPLVSRTRQVIKENLRQYVPQITRQDRVGLVERVQSNAEWNFDFVALMILSASIAALGLMQNSAAVVIGAMLVAPLMTPIIGMGLSLVQGNLTLLKISARALSRGIAVALLCGLFVGLMNSGFNEPTREVFARAQPGLLDIGVAFLSGLAAAYAQSRPNLIAALPGVAIAAALVPPIVAAGLLLSLWELELALGAFSLFVINMVAIVLASMLALFAVGLRQSKTKEWPAIITSALVVAFSALLIWSSINTYDVDIAGEIPAGIEEAIESALGPDYTLEDIAIAYDELGYQLNLDVAGNKPVPPDIAKTVRLKAVEFYGEASRIRLVARISAEEF